MERAARVGAAVGQAAQMRSAAALEAVGSYGGRTHRLGLDDDLDWRASRRDGRGGRVAAGSPAVLFVPLLARPGGGGRARR